ncbi:molybdenum cofactor guanylyltransferase [Chloroflexota bacterium]
MEINSIILAGGKGSRFGQDKILEAVGHRSLLEQVISCVSPLSKGIIIVIAEERFVPEVIIPQTIKVVSDIFPGKGPLGGIYTGLTASDTIYNIVVASDMPFLNPALLRHMVQVAPGYDLAIPRVDGFVEPLHAVFAKSCLPPIEKMLERRIFSVNQLLKEVKARYIDAEEIDHYDPEHLSFFNINTRADLVKARELAIDNANDKC